MQLSDNFSLEELTISETAVRRGIPNEPSDEVIENLKALCEHVLEPLREFIGAPLLITSGYRSPLLNQAIGGSKTSDHCKGLAADFHCNKYTVEELFQLIKTSNLPYKQGIQEFSKWCHISFSGLPARRENLRALKNGDGDTYYVHD